MRPEVFLRLTTIRLRDQNFSLQNAETLQQKCLWQRKSLPYISESKDEIFENLQLEDREEDLFS